MGDLVVFVHGMGTFETRRIKKNDQAELICKPLGRHRFRGIFDDSGNFAFSTSHSPEKLQSDILEALKRHLEGKKQKPVKGLVVINRESLEKALSELKAIAANKYKKSFQERNYTVCKNGVRWRLGFVFLDMEKGSKCTFASQVYDLNDCMEVLSVQEDMIGMLKFNPKKPRIPWGVPSEKVASFLGKVKSNVVATGRSARTVCGVLRVFQPKIR
jgi:hypothetical protein